MVTSAVIGQVASRLSHTFHFTIEQKSIMCNRSNKSLFCYLIAQNSEKHEREVKRELYRILLQNGIKDTKRMAKVANHIVQVIKGGI